MSAIDWRALRERAVDLPAEAEFPMTETRWAALPDAEKLAIARSRLCQKDFDMLLSAYQEELRQKQTEREEAYGYFHRRAALRQDLQKVFPTQRMGWGSRWLRHTGS